jgi:hypothetical protein
MTNTVRFSSYNQECENGAKTYLVWLQDGHESIQCLGSVYKSRDGAWRLNDYRYQSLAELKAVIRHRYTGSSLEAAK